MSNNGKVISKGNSVASEFLLTAASKRVLQEIHDSETIVPPKPKRQKTSVKINKNTILAVYDELCREKGIIKQETSTIVNGEPQFCQECPPRLHSLVIECKMKPSLDHQYQVMDLSLDNFIVLIIKNHEQNDFSGEDLLNLSNVNKLYGDMIKDVLRLRSKNFSELKKPRFNYAVQLSISLEQVDLARACCIHYGLHPGMLVRYITGEYVGESRDVEPILREVSPHISCEETTHIKRILMQGCPSYIDFEEESKNKLAVIWKGNQHTFLQYPEVTAKAMNKEEKNSHILPLRYSTVHFSPWLRVTPQGIRKKYNKFRVIFNSSTQTSPDKAVLNHITTTDLEANINFGQAKTNLFINIYNW